ncbi:hypothetical protein ACNSOL_12060 (plasmid) [Aliarcobacter lanthieri]|uniref:hypothetical protein n=1 Tax=Aliarcobacter lanthieri TaxID=1355374 RepID=UPI003AABF216
MNRRDILKGMIVAPVILAANKIDSNDVNTFKIAMYGDLDDDLIILKSTEEKTKIDELHQMHNTSGSFTYNGDNYVSIHSPGYIEFKKEYRFEKDEIYVVCLANEREDAGYHISERFRTHYKNEKLLIGNQVLLKALMPEYKSVPDYPLWLNEGDGEGNGNPYNYYNLFENSTVQTGFVVPREGNIKIMLFNNNDELKYSFEEFITQTPKYLESNELKEGKLDPHPFTEINNILNLSKENQIPNNEYITHALVVYEDRQYDIKFPYPAMYPNLFCAVAINKK